MKRGLHILEKVIDKLIFPALIILLVIVVLEFFYVDFVHEHHLYIEIIDGFVILIFLIDLIFKYFKVRNIPNFLKKYWLEIIAVIPFFWIFRAFEGFARIFGLVEETTKEGQQILHIGVEIAKGEEGVVKASRASRFEKFLKPLSRTPRFLKLKPEEYEKDSKKYIKEGKACYHFFEEPIEAEVKNTFKEAKLEGKKIKKILKV